jgi:hypothetical protein
MKRMVTDQVSALSATIRLICVICVLFNGKDFVDDLPFF